MIELRYLRTLVALRDCGSLIDAAEQVHLTQSALSHQIKELEDRLNLPVYLRKSKPLKFTLAGERLLKLADEILPLIKSAERDLFKLSHGQAGRLHIAIECHSCFQWLMPAIDAFREQAAEVDLDLSSGFYFAPLPALARGDLDLVITSDPQPLAGLHYHPLFSYEMVLAVSKKNPLAEKTFIAAQDLQDQTLITYPVDRHRLDIFTRLLDPANIEPAEIRTAELTFMMIQWVISNRGVCALPNWALEEYRLREDWVTKPLTEQGIWCTLYAAIRSEHQQTPYIQQFLEVAHKTCFAHLKGIQSVN